ncbi:tryptophan synthase beta subunit-like PLP-dependent enzyme [Chytridium lagenaria]|nr:tryptophan synthase beta subunit-like PLP-dependent enzyme [Chytridium lagenaria]
MHIVSPLIKAPQELADALNIKALYFKLDNLQPSGSFKIRGMSHLIRETLQLNPNLCTIVSSSGGNAGMAAALASKNMGIPCRVFVPSTTSDLVKQRLKALGASVVVSGSVWNEANASAMEYVEQVNQEKSAGSAKLVHPFDDSILWEGHASLAREILQQIEAHENALPDAIICSVGGGGLLAGILTGLIHLPEADRPHLVGVETEGAASFAAALKEGGEKPVKIAAITSIAKSLVLWKVRSSLVTDRHALNAVIRFADDERMLVEPACGAAVALGYDQGLLKSALPELGSDSIVVVVVCGGSGVTLESIKDWDIQV